jgi:cation transport regulator ChaC
VKDAYDLPFRWYFAYGSNLNPEQMGSRCRQPKAIAVARLPDHQLAFFGYSKKWDGGEATLIRQPGDVLWGVVYQLSFADAEHLDSWQDVRLDGTGPYFHYPVVVADDRRNNYSVLLYKKDAAGALNPPSREHLDYIIAGAQSHGLPPDYLARIRKMETRPAAFAVPRKSRFDRSILFDYCGSCGDAETGPNPGPGLTPTKAPRP